jgi:hypothetical protein
VSLLFLHFPFQVLETIFDTGPICASIETAIAATNAGAVKSGDSPRAAGGQGETSTTSSFTSANWGVAAWGSGQSWWRLVITALAQGLMSAAAVERLWITIMQQADLSDRGCAVFAEHTRLFVEEWHRLKAPLQHHRLHFVRLDIVLSRWSQTRMKPPAVVPATPATIDTSICR